MLQALNPFAKNHQHSIMVCLLVSLLGCISCLLLSNAAHAAKTSQLPDKPTKYLDDDDLPKRTPPLLELGGDFLGTGNIEPGFEIFTGAIWQPKFWVYGSARTALSSFESEQDNEETTQWANRLDLFGNLQLTGTERLLIGISPLHEDARFTGRFFSPDAQKGSIDETNLEISTLFFEGDFAELFPELDVKDATRNDIGFSFGRQQLLFQSGILINDTIDAFGLSKNNLRIPGVEWLVNARTSLVYGWNEINRHDGSDAGDSELWGLFTQVDTANRTMDLDIVYVDSDEANESDLLVAAFDSIQTIGKFGSTLRIAGSQAQGEETTNASNGGLLFAELSWVPPYSHDHIYISGFRTFDRFVTAARSATSGGGLGQTGILFAGTAVGNFPAALGSGTEEAFGFAAGRQFFFANRKQLLLEVGARLDTADESQDAYAVGFRWQQAFGRRTVFEVNGFYREREDDGSGYGLRTALQIKF